MLLTSTLLHTPEGMRDIYNGECRDTTACEEKIMNLLHLFGFEDVRTPGLEYAEVFNKERGTVPENEMYRLFDGDGNILAIRPDITPAIARLTARYFADSNEPLRFSYNEKTYRNTPGLRGQLKEVTQLGVELIGDGSVSADAEVVVAAIESLLSCGMKEFKVEISSAAFLNSLISPLALTDEDHDEIRKIIDNKNRYAMRSFLLGHADSISTEKINVLMDLTDDFGSMNEILAKENLNPVLTNPSFAKTRQALDRLVALDKIIAYYNLSEYVTYDLGMIGKLGYYTGIILRGYTYGAGRPILSGGRYDNLVSQFGKEAPAVGMAINMDELMNALGNNNIHPYEKKKAVTIVTPENKLSEAVSLRLSYIEKGIRAVIVTDNSAGDIELSEEEK